MRRYVRRGKAPGNESSEKEEIVEQQVNIGSLYFRNEKTLFVDVILAFPPPFKSGSERKKLHGERNLRESTGILYLLLFSFGFALWKKGNLEL